MKPKNMLKYATDWQVGDLHVSMGEEGYTVLREDGRYFLATDTRLWNSEHSLPKEDPLRFFDTLANAIRAAEADCESRGVKDAGFNHTQD